MKWTLGFDYTLTRELYLNAMWVHGFVDEFGAGDWLRGAVDVKRVGRCRWSRVSYSTAEAFGGEGLVRNVSPSGTDRKSRITWSAWC